MTARRAHRRDPVAGAACRRLSSLAPGGDAYEALGPLYDVWCESVVEDLDFYVEACAGVDGPIVELGVGSGRVAVPLALAGHAVRGLDASPAMLALARTRAEQAGVSDRIELSLGDLTDPPASLGPAARVLVPFRPYLHLEGDGERLRALRGARELLAPGGRLVFDVFEPTAADIRKTHDRWIEREAGIWERARWNAAERIDRARRTCPRAHRRDAPRVALVGRVARALQPGRAAGGRGLPRLRRRAARRPARGPRLRLRARVGPMRP